MIEKELLGRLTKMELIQENKKLQAKMQNLQDIDLYDSDVSSDDNFQEEPSFIPPSPPLRKIQSLTNISGEKNISEVEDEPSKNIEESSQNSEIDCQEESITKKKQIYTYIDIYIYMYTRKNGFFQAI